MEQAVKNALIQAGIDPGKLGSKELKYLEAIEAYYADTANVTPIMSDSQFDILEKEVKKINPDIVKFVGSKTKGTHYHPSLMLSLAKINIYDNDNFGAEVEKELKSFFSRTKHAAYIEAMMKYDGNAINLVYRGGKLDLALTRTDKETGFDKKYKLHHIVPNTIPEKRPTEVRGEIVIRTSDFDKYKKTKDNPSGSANERNYVAGVLGSDDVRINKVKELVFVGHEVRVHDSNSSFVYPYDMNDVEKVLGFNNGLKIPLINIHSYDDFKRIYKGMLRYRGSESPFRLDGIVLKASPEVRIGMGFNNHDPVWAVAVKFPPEDAMTTITDIVNTVGNDGEIYPKAILKPLDLDGSTVTKATLHNWGSVIEKKTYPGAVVVIVKGGDIIPQIYKLITPSDNVVNPPAVCPECGSPTRYTEPHLWCTNDVCPARAIGKMEDAVKILKIKGIGEATIRLLNKAGVVTVEDLFDGSRMNTAALVASGQFVAGRALEKVMEAVASFNGARLWEVIASLKITDVGESLSKELAKHYTKKGGNFGGHTKTAVALMCDPNSEEYQRMKRFLTILKDLGKRVEVPREDGVVFEMTGDPPEMDGMKHKADYQERLEKHGWSKGSINKANVLLTNSHNSVTGKMKTAKAKNIKIMTYEEAIESLK